MHLPFFRIVSSVIPSVANARVHAWNQPGRRNGVDEACAANSSHSRAMGAESSKRSRDEVRANGRKSGYSPGAFGTGSPDIVCEPGQRSARLTCCSE